jgi:hypothetical protein
MLGMLWVTPPCKFVYGDQHFGGTHQFSSLESLHIGEGAGVNRKRNRETSHVRLARPISVVNRGGRGLHTCHGKSRL